MDYIAERLGCIEASGIRRIWQMAATMKDPVNFSIGEPDFGAPEEMKRAAIEAIESDKSGYTVTSGLAELREELAGRISQEFGWSNPSVLITCGLSGALTLSLMATVNAGDGVLVPDPYFVSYRHLVNLNGGKCQFVNTYPDFGLTCERLDEVADTKSKVLFVNSPANPTGVLYQTERLKEIAEFASQKGLLVLSDEIYREFTRNINDRGVEKARAVVIHGQNYRGTNRRIKNLVAECDPYTPKWISRPTEYRKIYVLPTSTNPNGENQYMFRLNVRIPSKAKFPVFDVNLKLPSDIAAEATTSKWYDYITLNKEPLKPEGRFTITAPTAENNYEAQLTPVQMKASENNILEVQFTHPSFQVFEISTMSQRPIMRKD